MAFDFVGVGVFGTSTSTTSLILATARCNAADEDGSGSDPPWLVGAIVGSALAIDADGKLGDAGNVDKASALGSGRAGVWIAAGGLVAAAAGIGAGAFAAVSPDL